MPGEGDGSRFDTGRQGVTNETEMRTVALGDLVPHPDNPRLQLREDVIERIATEIGSRGFGHEHALLVRPKDARYEVISGHHRLAAAKAAGLAEVPCWVKDLDDGEAFMQLVLANTQGELDPLERGFHALRAERYADGGLRGYAERVGVKRERISVLRSAATVARKCGLTHTFFGKAEHLYEISKAPPEIWPLLSECMLTGWAVADVNHHVKAVREFQISDEDAHWLPLAEVARRYLDTQELSPKTVGRLVAAAAQTREWIAANGHEEDRQAFEIWLDENSGGKAWQPRAIAEYLARLIAGQFIVEGWHQGDWRDHLASLDDGSVSLLLTDPPYGMGYQSDYRLDRRAEHKHDEIAGDGIDAFAEVQTALEAFHPKLAKDAHVLVFCGWAGEPQMREAVEKAGYTIRGSLIWDKQATGMGDPETTFAPAHERILHAVKGSPLLYRRAPDLLRHSRCDSSRHPTEKPVPLLRELIEATTAEGQVVADPFAGVASVPASARETHRRWWGCELSKKYWTAGEERLS